MGFAAFFKQNEKHTQATVRHGVDSGLVAARNPPY